VDESLAEELRHIASTVPDPAGLESKVATPPEDVAKLIRDAFAQAREAGKQPWTRMQAGVLKNRLLLLTNGEFDEKNWGALTFTEFLDSLPDLVRVDRSVKPPAVELTVGAADQKPGSDSSPPRRPRVSPLGPWRIRSDLWSAVLDYDKGLTFVWDDGAVKEIPTSELGSDDPRPHLPTVTADELQTWRREFASRHTKHVVGAEDSLARWVDDAATSWALPRPLRDAWFAELKEHVRSRLQEWFEANAVEPPADLAEPAVRRSARGPRDGDTTAALRALVVRCVEAMTRDELEALRLPPAAVLRSQR
jgi:hypothetical protein